LNWAAPIERWIRFSLIRLLPLIDGPYRSLALPGGLLYVPALYNVLFLSFSAFSLSLPSPSALSFSLSLSVSCSRAWMKHKRGIRKVSWMKFFPPRFYIMHRSTSIMAIVWITRHVGSTRKRAGSIRRVFTEHWHTRALFSVRISDFLITFLNSLTRMLDTNATNATAFLSRARGVSRPNYRCDAHARAEARRPTRAWMRAWTSSKAGKISRRDVHA